MGSFWCSRTLFVRSFSAGVGVGMGDGSVGSVGASKESSASEESCVLLDIYCKYTSY